MSGRIVKYVMVFALLIGAMVVPITKIVPGISGNDLNNAILIEYVIIYMMIASSVIKDSVDMITHGRIIEYNHIIVLGTIIFMLLGKYPDGVLAMLLYCIIVDVAEGISNSVKKDIYNRVDMRGKKAEIRVEQTKASVNAGEVVKGMIIEVNPGEMIPLDGYVRKGLGYVDLSALCGESVTMPVKRGDYVKSGAYAINEKLEIEVNKDVKTSFTGRLYEQFTGDGNEEAKLTGETRKLSVTFMIIFLAFSIVLSILTPIISGFKGFDVWIYKGACIAIMTSEVLIVSTIDTGMLVGMYRCLKKGVLVKGKDALDKLARIRSIVFDQESASERFASKAVMLAKKLGINRFAIISDADEKEVKKTGAIIGIDEEACYGNLTMTALFERLKSMNDFSPELMFIGDYKTDNVMISRASVGVACGLAESYDDYMEFNAGNVIALKDSPEAAVDNILTANETIVTVDGNIKIAFAYKLISIILLIVGIAPISICMCGEILLLMILMMRSTKGV